MSLLTPPAFSFFFTFYNSNVITFKCHRCGGVTVVTGLFFFFLHSSSKKNHTFSNYHSKGQMDFKAKSLNIYLLLHTRLAGK